MITETASIPEVIWYIENAIFLSLFITLTLLSYQERRGILGAERVDGIALRRVGGMLRRHLIRVVFDSGMLYLGAVAIQREQTNQAIERAIVVITLTFILGMDGVLDLIDYQWFRKQPIGEPVTVKLLARTKDGKRVEIPEVQVVQIAPEVEGPRISVEDAQRNAHPE